MVCATNPDTTDDEPSAFDVEQAAVGLLADPSRASLQLPCLLSVEQRRHAKKIAEQYPDLKCESFGMGKDRQMHLFKVQRGSQGEHAGALAGASSPQGVSVKNTFIDDWIDADSGEQSDARVVQSMPHNMFTQCLSQELSMQLLIETSLVDNEASATLDPVTEQKELFPVGAEVVIDGLVKTPSFNGAMAVVQSWDADVGRYNVLLASSSGEFDGQRWAKIRAENLRAVPSSASRC